MAPGAAAQQARARGSAAAIQEVNRLWCILELYIHFAMSGSAASKRTIIVNCRTAVAVVNADADSSKDKAGESEIGRAATTLVGFDVKDAHCYSAEDEAKLRRVIESESASSFNEAIREAGLALLSEVGDIKGTPHKLRSSNGNASIDTENPLAGDILTESAIDKVLREQFVALDSNEDGRLCRSDLLKGFGRMLSEEQVDDLLGIIADTGSHKLLVNGSLSIGLEEFKPWIKRSK